MEIPITPTFRLDGQKALVTGASRGIGLAAAAALAEAGAAVTLAARPSADLDAAVDALLAAGHEAGRLEIDLTDLDALAAALQGAPTYSVLVNNAGMNRPASITEVSVADFDAIMGLNVRSAFFVAQSVVARLLKAKQPGSIINVSSQMGHVGAANRSIYCASKAAIEGMTKAMAVELAPFGIRVNALAPTFIETEMTKPFLDVEEFRSGVLEKIKLGKIGQVQDVMGGIVFLASPASALMTGASLVVDGGWTAE